MPAGPPTPITFAEADVLRLLLDKTEQGFWFIDNDLRTTDANPAMCRMLRTTRETMLGRSIYEFVDAANAEIFREHVRLRALGLADSYEITLKRDDGDTVDCYNNATPVFDAQGRKVGAIGLFSDISALKRTQRQLHDTGVQLAVKSRVLEHTLDGLDQGVLTLDADGHVSAFNQRMLELLQLPQQLLQGHPTIETIIRYQLEHGLLDAPASELGRRAVAGELRQPDYDPSHLAHDRYLRRTHEGRMLQIQSRGSSTGEVVRTYTDVTDRIQAEAALVAAKEEAERANRAKSEFLRRMSHELRTPLNAILGFAELMEGDQGEPLGDAQRARLRELRRGGEHLLSLINEVLDLARIEAGAIPVELAPVALWPLVADCLTLLAPTAAGHGVQVQLADEASTPLHVRADGRRLRQVLINLLSNAIKYNRARGRVTVNAVVQARRVRVSITDEGPGIGAEAQARLFTAFERLDADRRSIEGAGIGLALSRQLMELMGGRIGVDSRPGHGSTFWIELPASAAPRRRKSRSAASAQGEAPAPSRRSRVVYIEDNEVNQLLMAGMLAQRPAIDLEQHLDPLPGLQACIDAPPDLVLLDIQLPGIDGLEVLRRLRAQAATAQVPVVAVSANAMQADIDAALDAGFDAYLTKPLSMEQLLDTVDRWLAEPASDSGPATLI